MAARLRAMLFSRSAPHAAVEVKPPPPRRELPSPPPSPLSAEVEAFSLLKSPPPSPSHSLAQSLSGLETNFCDLPAEIIQLLASWHLEPADASALLCTCAALLCDDDNSATTVWCVKLQQLGVDYRAKYGEPSSKSPSEWRKILATEIAFHRKVSCTTGAIMHGNNPRYWEAHTKCGESLFGEVAECRTVCWFDIKVDATLPRGRYAVSWGVDSASRWGSQHINLSVCTRERTGTTVSVGAHTLVMSPAEIKAALARSASKGWSRLPVGTVEVTGLEATVQARIWRHGGSWIGPIKLDYVDFAPIAKNV